MSGDIESKSMLRKVMNKNVLIMCKNYKQYVDLLKFLYQYYIKKD